MRLSGKLLCCFVVLGVLSSLVFSLAEEPESVDYPVKNLRVPIDHYEDGSVKVQLFAEGARVKRKDETELKGVRVEFYTKGGLIDATVSAEKCVYHSRLRAVMSEDRVRIEKQGIIITGRRFEWHSEDETFEILNDARVEFARSVRKQDGSENEDVLR